MSHTSNDQLLNYIKCLESSTSMPHAVRGALSQTGKIFSECRHVVILVAEVDNYANLMIRPTWSMSLDEATIGELYAEYLNEILKSWLSLIDSSGGSILELQPNTILIMWGIPTSIGSRTDAVATAIEMQVVCEKLRKNHLIPQDFAFRIGLASGQAYMGMIGTETRQTYMAVGPVTVYASQLSRVAQPGQILLSRTIYEQVKDTVICEKYIEDREIFGIESECYIVLREE